MDRVDKALRKLSAGQRASLKKVLTQIKSGAVSELDIVKLRGAKDIYRIRRGDMRIIAIKSKGGSMILTVERRTTTAYKKRGR